MTWDHIATAIVGGVPTLAVALVALLAYWVMPRRARGTLAEGIAVNDFPYLGAASR